MAGHTLLADGPADNREDAVRRVPRLGIELSPEDRRELERGIEALETALAQIDASKNPLCASLRPDVAIYHKAVRDAVRYQEIFAPAELEKAKNLVKEGLERSQQLLEGSAPWTTRAGLVVRGYVSRIDGSVQPYGLVVPDRIAPQTKGGYRLDVWFHGRGEMLSELNFMDERGRVVGTFAPEGTIVLHPYGRYCNAFKFAGEVDVLEAIEAVQKHYPIDEDRISVRGFSMGGAAAWQFAVHYPDRWYAANPGAGFSETPRFLKVFQKESLDPTWFERKLWGLYDCDQLAANLLQCPTVAYSGELDAQKQAADVMAEALRLEGVELCHLIGPATKHAYHPATRDEVARRMDSLAARGRERSPRSITFVTTTLKYNRMHWLTVDALEQHWEKARVDASVVGDSALRIQTDNVSALTLEMPSGWCPLDPRRAVAIEIDGVTLEGPKPLSDRSWRCPLVFRDGRWTVGAPDPVTLRKRHGLQGPIDDAFMDSFVFVLPTGKSPHPKLQKWVEEESGRAIEHWRRQFRGEAQVIADREVKDTDVQTKNLVLWGDPSSNSVLARITGRLPIHWTDGSIDVGDRRFTASDHALLGIYPNPLNPDRYIVLNSGFTFREYDYLNNARQVPKLPDWAVIDLNTPPDAKRPGRIVDADFFGESWELRPPRGN